MVKPATLSKAQPKRVPIKERSKKAPKQDKTHPVFQKGPFTVMLTATSCSGLLDIPSLFAATIKPCEINFLSRNSQFLYENCGKYGKDN